MIVGKRMQKNLITIRQNDMLKTAISLMREKSIRHLPVVDNGKLIGIITAGDLHRVILKSEKLSTASKSGKKHPALSLKCKEVMIEDPIVISPDTDLEQAARLIHYHKIDGLPVVEDGRLVGIITMTDILEVFIEIMTVISSTARIDVILGGDEKEYDKALKLISKRKAELISVAMSAHQDPSERIYFFRLKTTRLDAIAEDMNKSGFQVVSTFK